jgi:hypothetical protein
MAEPGNSICWSCHNARADRCAWIEKKVKVWEKAYARLKEENSGRGYKVYVVRECKQYALEEVERDGKFVSAY